jgi:hypothetical protein
LPKALIEVHAPIGRSDPQAVYLANSLSRLGWEVRLLQCLSPGEDYSSPDGFLDSRVESVTYAPTNAMWARSAVIEYALECSSHLETWKPDVFFAYDFAGQLSVSNARSRRILCTEIVVMQLETLSYTKRFFGPGSYDIIGLAWSGSLVVYPECNRLLYDSKVMDGIGGVPKRFDILPPSVPRFTNPSVDLPENIERDYSNRTDRSDCVIVYAGSIVEETYIFEFLESIIQLSAFADFTLKVLVAGPVGKSVQKRFHSLLEKIPFARYLGILNQNEITKLVRSAHFSFIGWKPLDENFFYCAPNKFFQALALGAIPICVPSPIFIAASRSFESLELAYLGWGHTNWPEELRAIIEYYMACFGAASKSNLDVFDDQMCWDVEFERFYRRNFLE